VDSPKPSPRVVVPTVDVEDAGCCANLVSADTKEMMHEMLDISLFKDPIFILFVVSNFCTSIGFNIPYVYVVVSIFL
jgi:hypothetical protein